jgi:hypothetical protein
MGMTWHMIPRAEFPDEAIDVTLVGDELARPPGWRRGQRIDPLKRDEFIQRYRDWLHEQALGMLMSIWELHDVTRMIGGLDEGMLGQARETGDPVGDLSDLLGRADAWLHLADRHLLANRDDIDPARVADAAGQARELLGRARTLGRTLTGEREGAGGREDGACPSRPT